MITNRLDKETEWLSMDAQARRAIYEKHQSFETFFSNKRTCIDSQTQRAVQILNAFLHSTTAYEATKKREVLSLVLKDLNSVREENTEFRLTVPIVDELVEIENSQVPRYLYHRYRYDIYPQKKILDEYPPYFQIEPTSICNYRCVFCYQSDASFTRKQSGHMGSMSIELFKNIIDQIEGEVDFISIASRGEPLICKDIDQMLRYCVGKFLSLKINTNASLLNEEHCHAILAGGVNTVVFSADAVDKSLYEKLRVGGKLENIVSNIKMFQSIRKKHYPSSKIITRVSGVKVCSEQSMASMKAGWSDLVDQVCFVHYNPWENVYSAPLNQLDKPCSDLWRRMFVWFDGTVNPCDTDYMSTLSVGSIKNSSFSEIWRSKKYQELRQMHLKRQRADVSPCQRCVVV